MVASNVINDIKVIFFIINTIVGVLAGFVWISLGVSFGLLIQTPSNESGYALELDPYPYNLGITIAYIIVGLIVLGAAALGYAGAIRQNRIMLFVYTGVMVLAALVDILIMATIEGIYFSDIYLLTPVITHLGLVMLAIILAVVLAVKSRNQSNQGMILSPPPAAYIPVA